LLLVNDIRRQNGAIRHEIDMAIGRVLDRGWYILGPEVRAFEEEWAAYCGAAYCVTVGNGTDALELALRALGIGADKRVATVANAGMYGTTAILRAGATPEFVDVEPDSMVIPTMVMPTMLMPPNAAGSADAVIVTHLYGHVATPPPGVHVVEDCAQAHGKKLQGHAACFSFYPTKNLGALGDGGAIVTNDESYAAELRALRQYGWTSKYNSARPGGRNSRMDELQAAILRAKLPYLNEWNRRRAEIASRYDTGLGVTTPDGSFNHLYVLRSRDRQRMRDHLAERQIATDVHYPIPDHRQPSVAEAITAAVSLPVTERLCEEVFTLPLFPEMTDADVDRVIEAVLETRGDRNESLLA
jgi:dTDP-3-amino-2,3,6-trideoxy-4-keto-D-glucose/dTDP-3-amino-3,4,6-trideoxy-alpha-D-glucose/dTDP-2,6-dideoxy-D-kanosamine transaminase